MFTPMEITGVAQRLASFCTAVDGIDGVDLLNTTIEVKVNSKQIPDLVSFKVTPSVFVIQYKEDTHVFPKPPSPEMLKAALKKHQAAHLDVEMLHALACKLSQHGIVYIEAITPELFDFFLKTWSDAYGEDNPDIFMKRHPNGHDLYGFVRTNLTPAQIAARNNEDGDDDYKPEPLFNNMKEA